MTKFIRGMAAGMLIGAAAEMMVLPYCDKNVRRRMRRAGQRMRGIVEDTYEGMQDFMR